MKLKLLIDSHVESPRRLNMHYPSDILHGHSHLEPRRAGCVCACVRAHAHMHAILSRERIFFARKTCTLCDTRSPILRRFTWRIVDPIIRRVGEVTGNRHFVPRENREIKSRNGTAALFYDCAPPAIFKIRRDRRHNSKAQCAK